MINKKDFEEFKGLAKEQIDVSKEILQIMKDMSKLMRELNIRITQKLG